MKLEFLRCEVGKKRELGVFGEVGGLERVEGGLKRRRNFGRNLSGEIEEKSNKVGIWDNWRDVKRMWMEGGKVVGEVGKVMIGKRGS